MLERSSFVGGFLQTPIKKRLAIHVLCSVLTSLKLPAIYLKDSDPMTARHSFEEASPCFSYNTTKRGLSKHKRYGSILAFRADHVAQK